MIDCKHSWIANACSKCGVAWNVHADYKTQLDQWREVAERLAEAAAGVASDIEWPPIDVALGEFRKLKEEEASRARCRDTTKSVEDGGYGHPMPTLQKSIEIAEQARAEIAKLVQPDPVLKALIVIDSHRRQLESPAHNLSLMAHSQPVPVVAEMKTLAAQSLDPADDARKQRDQWRAVSEQLRRILHDKLKERMDKLMERTGL